jgi:hypothetical protein
LQVGFDRCLDWSTHAPSREVALSEFDQQAFKEVERGEDSTASESTLLWRRDRAAVLTYMLRRFLGEPVGVTKEFERIGRPLQKHHHPPKPFCDQTTDSTDPHPPILPSQPFTSIEFLLCTTFSNRFGICKLFHN